MKPIKVFVASSVNEFAEERLVLKDFTRRLSDVLVDCGIHIRLFICEYAENAMAAGRMQSEYNREIEDSDLFLLIAGYRLGEYTLEEYKFAQDISKRKKISILAALKDCPEPEASIQAFRRQLSEDAIVPITFHEVGGLKEALARALAGILEEDAKLEICDGKVFVNGQAAASL